MTTALEAMRAVNFDWAVSLAETWVDYWDDTSLHADARRAFDERLAELHGRVSSATIGWILTGAAGSGKTHLLGAFRRKAWAAGAAFVLVDMTGVRDFGATLLQATLDSLQQRFSEDVSQYRWVLANVIQRLGAKEPLSKVLTLLAKRKSNNLPKDMKEVLERLYKIYPAETVRHQDVVRAIICWNSDEFATSSIGLNWLQGQSLTQEEAAAFGFKTSQQPPLKILNSLGWLLSLSGPTIIAFDQLDTLVRQHEVAKRSHPDSDSAAEAWAIIQNVGEGLGTLRDHIAWAKPIVSCLEGSFPILRQVIPQSYLDRFDDRPFPLAALDGATVGQSIIRQRLQDGYTKAGFTPPYPTWPFRPESFASAGRLTPRELLKLCHRKRADWIATGSITEVQAFKMEKPETEAPAFAADQFATLDARYRSLLSNVDVTPLLGEKEAEAATPSALGAALQCLVAEGGLPDGIRATILTEFTGATTTRPLHARASLVDETRDDDESIYCFRAIQHSNSRAFQARLSAAMTESGIDRALPFRTLAILRSGPMPGGEATGKLIKRFEEAGGIWLQPEETELRALLALQQLRADCPPGLDEWLADRRPASDIGLFRRTLLHKLRAPAQGGPQLVVETAPARPQATQTPAAPVAAGVHVSGRQPSEGAAETGIDPQQIRLGTRLDATGGGVHLPLEQLCKHTLILAGSGSGKTVLLKRLVEEAALRNIPSIVIDPIGNLAQLGQAWDTPPNTWGPDDPTLAKHFRERANVVVWTPGRESDTPLSLELIPDFRSVAGSADELEGAVAMVRDMLAPMVAGGKSAAADNKRGILSRSLRSFLANDSGLPRYIEYLRALPDEARVGIAKEDQLAGQMADGLAAKREQNPLLRSAGEPLDPALLLADEHGRARVSIISFVGLPTPDSQHVFLGQLAATLFGWLKRQPRPVGRPLHGILVVDEAREFVPGSKATPCREGFLRLAAQARNYRFGLVFATQNPKDIITTVVSQCSTHFYGKQNSPATIDAVRDLLQQKGASGDDIARLEKGRFYVHNADAIPRPLKIQTPMSLSRHE